RIRMGDLAVRVDAGAAQLGDGTLETAFRLRVGALGRVALRRDDQEAGVAALCALPDLVEQRLAEHGLVGDHQHVLLSGLVGDDQQVHQRTGTSSTVRSPFRTAWRAPGTPYSYGFPTTCGISSKLNTGGGDETCHSSVKDRHGLPGAIAPRRMLVTML